MPAQMSLRQQLIKDFGIDPEKLRGKTDAELLDIMRYYENLDELSFEEGSVNTLKEGVTLTDTKNIPVYGSAEWSDYVLEQFADDELQEGNPTVDGLRRVAEQLIGRIITFSSKVKQFPSPENDYSAVVEATIQVMDANDEIIIMSGAADASPRNTSGDYKKYPVAVAETRAEGRALKRLLKLKKVVAAEEIGGQRIEEDDGKINSQQLNMLAVMCENKLDVNIEKLLEENIGNVKKVTDLTHEQAAQILKTLNGYQLTVVPEELRGFDPDWKKRLY